MPFFTSVLNAQVNIGSTTAPESGLALKLTSDDKGVIFPQYALTSKKDYRPLPIEPPTGTLVFNTNTFGSFPNEVYPGLYWWDNERNEWLPFAQNTEHYTAKFSNFDETTNLFTDYYVNVPIFGKLDFTDMPGEYEIVSSSQVKFNRAGLYSVTVNMDLYTSKYNPIGIEIVLLKDGTPLKATKRSSISQENEHYFTEIFTEYVSIDVEGEILSLQAKRITTGSGDIRMNSVGSSTVTISRIR